MTKEELDISMSKLGIARELYNNAVHIRHIHDSFKGNVRDSIRKAGVFEIKPISCYSVEIPLTDEVRKALDIIEAVLKDQAEKAEKAFENFKMERV